jgi:hypothetical protein
MALYDLRSAHALMIRPGNDHYVHDFALTEALFVNFMANLGSAFRAFVRAQDN